uniref:glutamate-rich protein 6B n=1 Tax=Euleptes europaea TaxID=460621 RepID=UPI002541C798|nr:glutamate-rich protein 6B [Euleptes europaea]
MSKEQNVSESGREGNSQPEIPSAPSGEQSVGPGLSTSCLTIENVKKLQEDYPAAKSSLARQSVEAYLQQSHLLGTEHEHSREGRTEPRLPEEKESQDRSFSPLGEERAEIDTEILEKISSPDFQTRSLTSSAPETKKREFADLETQTEWSYSSISLDLCEQVDSSEEGMAEMVLEAYLKAEDHYITHHCRFCEFCTAALKPFPTPEELEEKPERMESVPCCRTYKDILQSVIQDLMEAQYVEGGIDITPHRHLSQSLVNSRTKNHLLEELEGYGIENYKEVFEQYIMLGPCVKIGYKLSNHAPKPRPVRVKKRPKVKELLKLDMDFKPEQAKICHPVNPVKRYYPDGKIFYLLLPDGTGQVYYPSGNIAILITYLKDVQFTYIVLADRPNSRLIAFFSNQGYVGCYHLNEKLRLHMDLCWGHSFDDKGLQQKRWNWWDATRHVHAPPFQPIVIPFNVYVQVKVDAQDQIFLTFTKLHNCIRLNVGARLKLKDPAMLPFLMSSGIQKPPISQAKALQIKMLLAKLRKGLNPTCDDAPPEQKVHIDTVALMINRLQRWRQKKLFEQNK